MEKGVAVAPGKDRIVVGNIEVAALAPIRSPAVSDDEGAVAWRGKIKVGFTVAVVPADNGHGVVGNVASTIIIGVGGAFPGDTPVRFNPVHRRIEGTAFHDRLLEPVRVLAGRPVR